MRLPRPPTRIASPEQARKRASGKRDVDADRADDRALDLGEALGAQGFSERLVVHLVLVERSDLFALEDRVLDDSSLALAQEDVREPRADPGRARNHDD